MRKLFSIIITTAFAVFLSVSCSSNASCPWNPTTPDWAKKSTIYEVNIRQFTPEGTFAAFKEHLPRLQALGVDILWFMPIHPIGVKDRKGTLGSYYSVKCFRQINPEFGTEEEFKDLVREIHRLGMRIILDFVPNHTARDHRWVTENPDWYTWREDGTLDYPHDWNDIAQLNWSNPAVHDAILEEMLFQIREWNIDGFRQDAVGYFTPVEFWERARREMDKIRPTFHLAEDEQWRVMLHRAFDANYFWHFSNGFLNGIAQGRYNVQQLMDWHEQDIRITPRRAFRMAFTSNHDENSWVGTEFTRMGDAKAAMAVLTFTFENTFPLIYNGQEVGFNRMLEFFEKDEIDWDSPRAQDWTDFYTTLVAMKKDNEALWNGEWGGRMVRINTNEQERVLAFIREQNGNRIFNIMNLSDRPVTFTLEGNRFVGEYTEVISGVGNYFTTNSGSRQNFTANQTLSFEPWSFQVFSSNL